VNFRHGDKALGRNTALSPVDHPAAHTNLRGLFGIGIAQHKVRIASAQFEHTSLRNRAGLRPDGLPGFCAAGQRYGSDFRMLDHGFDLGDIDKQHTKDILRKAGFEHVFFDGERGTGDIVRVFRSTCQKGKFHGMMARSVPRGRYAT